ncbi:MAG: isocitrate/isopropylmalate dehydrogenase family protein, partial [Candidatus Bathyarchaeia archaeon]
MREYSIALMPGDGIGPELTQATLMVLEAVQRKYDVRLSIAEVQGGDGALMKVGVALPEETVEVIRNSHACLKGPVGETAADVIVKLRVMFDLYANLRPAKVYPNVPSLKPDIDMLIVRENTEDVYRGLELELDRDTMVCLRVITRRGSERIIRYAFECARQRKKKYRVTAVHKSNVMRKTDGLFSSVFKEVAKQYPEISSDEMYVDNAAMQLIRRPEEFDVIVTTNMFGDILSDEAAITVGGLGMAPGANIGDNFALFEPVHGSAPKYAGLQIANPTSMILASSMMLGWLGIRYKDEACREAGVAVEKALADTLAAGIMTRDLGGNAKTNEFGAAVSRM